ncbi:uncharacterized protein BDW43DRAFT_311005 [Aspergillus alliaceus]|uniref:uncharacterized protein n=1 Tax=Petromyces alliaceus TaxID=209559 RepID=UPI0012A448F6|nr:uncharacterized protein BDW43DRAFT_311005 [Aspergillus alliaceus]KAB8233659.1 hypothetical protein BDW43DRAFT_311005 [Aspergillus alliaceus]
MTLTVHHLHISQSERIAGLCEELGIDYELKTYKRAPLLGPARLQSFASPRDRARHPRRRLDAGRERRMHRGQLFLPPRHPAYADFLYWWHWSNGTFMPTMMKSMSLRSLKLSGDSSHMIMTNSRFKRAFTALNDRLHNNEWLAGSLRWQISWLCSCSLPYGIGFPTVWMSTRMWPSIFSVLGGREAYQKAMRKCEPDLEPALGVDLLKKEE